MIYIFSTTIYSYLSTHCLLSFCSYMHRAFVFHILCTISIKDIIIPLLALSVHCSVKRNLQVLVHQRSNLFLLGLLVPGAADTHVHTLLEAERAITCRTRNLVQFTNAIFKIHDVYSLSKHSKNS